MSIAFQYWVSGDISICIRYIVPTQHMSSNIDFQGKESLKAIDLPTYILDSNSTPKQPLESISAPCRMHPLTAFEVELGQLRFSLEQLRFSVAPDPAPPSPVDSLPLLISWQARVAFVQ